MNAPEGNGMFWLDYILGKPDGSIVELTHTGLKVFRSCGWLHFCSTGYQNNLKVLYSQVTPSSVKKTRYISSVPDRILDAPDLRNDFCKLMV